MATPKKKKTGEGLYKKRFATLKEHRAAVAARKTLKDGKNIGPVAHGSSYAKALTASKKKADPTPKAATPKTTPKKSTPKADPQRNTGSGRDGSFGLGTSGKGRPSDPARPNQTKNGASLGSKLSPAEKKRRAEAAASVGKNRRTGTSRGGSRASNNNRGQLRANTSGPKVGSTRRIRKGRTYVTQMWDGKKYVTGRLGTKGAKG